MTAPIYIGDDYTAAALRLAGVRVRVPGDEDPVALFNRILEETEFVLLGTAFSERLPRELLEDALRRGEPLVSIMPDVLGQEAYAGSAVNLRRQLGWGQTG